tara:strand:+ start:953 stop:1159 length:207 start_codon:yes stop_codon:yes gene_type:complete
MSKIERLEKRIEDLQRQIDSVRGDVDSNMRLAGDNQVSLNRLKDNLRAMVAKIAARWGVPDYRVGDME